jgi:hypothetical protein
MPIRNSTLKFGGIIPDRLIEELAEDLSDIAPE